jgi:hypothetical protein
MRLDGRMFQHPLRGLHSEGLSPMLGLARVETVLFSFEGSDPHVPVPDLLNDFGPGQRG